MTLSASIAAVSMPSSVPGLTLTSRWRARIPKTGFPLEIETINLLKTHGWARVNRIGNGYSGVCGG